MNKAPRKPTFTQYNLLAKMRDGQQLTWSIDRLPSAEIDGRVVDAKTLRAVQSAGWVDRVALPDNEDYYIYSLSELGRAALEIKP